MKAKIVVLCILATQQLLAQSYQKIHTDAIVIDTHNDILTKMVDDRYALDTDLKAKTHTDLDRWKKGGLDAQIFSVFCDGEKANPFAYANQQMDALDKVLKRNPDKIAKAKNSKDLLKIVKQRKIAAMFGVEGGHMIENDLNKLEHLYNRGTRYMTLTWNNSTPWATSAFDETFTKDSPQKGLTAFGKKIVQRMNELGMIVDISHVGEQTFWDVIHTTTKPVIASHSAVYSLCPHQRNLKDDQIKAIAKNEGVIQVNFYSGFLDPNYMKNKDAFIEKHRPEADSLYETGMADYQVEGKLFTKYKTESDLLRAPFSLLMQHIEYIIKLVGVDYVGLGSDFDGIESPPLQLDDVATYPLITKALAVKGIIRRK